MAQVYSIDGVEIENRVRTTADPSGVEGLPSSAWYGEAMIAGVTIEDPEGELDLMGWHTFTHDETDCTGAERTFTGWITGKNISRGSGRQAAGAARIWECEIIDQNAVWKLKLFRAASAQRPAETDIERMDFMRSSAPMAATPVADNGRWNVTDNPTNVGAASYVAQYPIDLANSVAGVSGKNFYAYWDDAAGEISGHYDLTGANPLSTIAISNVIADRDATTVYPWVDAVLTRSPEDQVNGVLYQYIGNQYVYVQNASLFGPGEFSPDNFDRDVLYSTDRVGHVSTAQAQAAAQLAARSTEKDTITVTVELPPAQVNLLHAGMRVAARFSHLPGYEGSGGVELAVIRRDVIPPRVVGGLYTVRLELSNMVAPTGPGGGDPGDFPPEPPAACDPDDLAIVATASYNDVEIATPDITISPSPSTGKVVVLDVAIRGPSMAVVPGGDWSALTDYIQTGADQNFRLRRYAKVWTDDDSDTVTFAISGTGSDLVRVVVTEIAGVGLDIITTDTNSVDANDPPTATLGTVTPTAGVPTLLLGAMVLYDNVSTSVSAQPVSPAVELIDENLDSRAPLWTAYYVEDNPTGALTMQADNLVGGILRGYVSVLTAFSCTSGEDLPTCPEPGQWTDWFLHAEGDGTTSQFTLDCPYADGGLLVKVDNLDITLGLTETDPAAGVFDLDFAPKAAQGDAPAEQVWVKYQGR